LGPLEALALGGNMLSC